MRSITSLHDRSNGDENYMGYKQSRLNLESKPMAKIMPRKNFKFDNRMSIEKAINRIRLNKSIDGSPNKLIRNTNSCKNMSTVPI
jgi:hypothetical protein